MEKGGGGKEVQQEGTSKSACPAIQNVTGHGGNISLVEQSWFDLPSHALSEAVVGHRQHDGAEEPTAHQTTNSRRQGSEGHGPVDHLEDWELQHVGGEGGQKELGHVCNVDIIQCRRDGHSLHQQSVHNWLTHGRQDGCHKGCGTPLSRSSKDLGEKRSFIFYWLVCHNQGTRHCTRRAQQSARQCEKQKEKSHVGATRGHFEVLGSLLLRHGTCLNS
mmetsp:Transcript_11693/g.14656  ORF Transcript_11693/g.14656 Transcript_11693/m.14656 type:complete len:218 (-) Transcript_11693:8-661(-)